jgi:FAD/FMN-containing dehydrogenase
VPGAIHSDARLGGTKGAIEILLDRYTGVTFDEARREVTVQAGCRFGADSCDPTGRATEDAGLCAQLDRRGWALPNMGGVSHPTVAGFLSTGSAGGSIAHGLHDAVVALRLVDGRGDVHTLSREQDPEGFAAAGVGLGLLGIISSVTFACAPRFDVIGSEQVMALGEAPMDVFADDARGLAAFFAATPYARLLWWPQVDKLVVWTARPMAPSDYGGDRGPAWALRPRPYQAFPRVFGTDAPVQAAAGGALVALGRWRTSLEDRVAAPLRGVARRIGRAVWARKLEAKVIDAFVLSEETPRPFWDSWHRSLPMDDQIDERWMPTTFFEVWVPIERAGEAMRRVRSLYERSPHLAGQFAVELYGAGESPFWLSPSHGGARVRINVFWLERHGEDPRGEVLPAFLSALADLDPRLHWGKLLPRDLGAFSKHAAQSYARWNDFERVRARFDPDEVFATEYWRAARGETASAADTKAPWPMDRRFDGGASGGKWPLAFPMRQADPSLLQRARFVIDVQQYVAAPPSVVHACFVDVSRYGEWLPSFVRADWITEPNRMGDGGVFDESLEFMTIRVKTIEDVPGVRWVAVVLASSLPLGTEMIEQVDFDAAADGGTDVRWRVAYELPPMLVPFDGMVSPLFSAFFASGLSALAGHVTSQVSSKALWPAERAGKPVTPMANVEVS